MRGGGTQHSMRWRGQGELAAVRGSHRFRTSLAALDSVVVSIVCLWVLSTFHPPKEANLGVAFFYVLLSCAIGALNFWVFAPRMGRRFGLRTTRLALSWVLIPPAVLLFRADSRLCVCAGILVGATFVLAVVERRDFQRRASLAQHDFLQFQLFEAEASSALPPWTMMLLSLLLFATVVAAGWKWLMAAVLLGAVSAGLAGFRWASFNEKSAVFRGSTAHHAKRLGVIALASVVITSMLLMPRQVHEAQAADWRAAQALLKVLKGPADHARKHAAPAGGEAAMAGVPKIFLWPQPPQKKTRVLIAPPTADKARMIHRSLVIPFDGPYIYSEDFGAGVRIKPLVAHGSPLKVKVKSVDGGPISMVARQRLTPPIDVASCGAIQVTIRRVAPETATALDVVLSNTGVPHGAPLRLATRPLQQVGSSGVGGMEQTLTFRIPADAQLRAFNQIKVLVLREAQTEQRGAHVEIEHFTLLPR